MAFFPPVDGHRRLAGRVCSEPDLVVGVGIYWALGGDFITIVLVMGRAETGMIFSRFGASGLRWLQSSD